MDIYAASDGSLVRLSTGLAEFESIDHLYEEVSTNSGVLPQNVLMFLSDGRELKAEVLEEAWDRGGEAGMSNSRVVVYLFDRETFFTDAEISAARYTEETQLPPELPLSAIHDAQRVQSPFKIAEDHIQHLQSLFVAQSNALSIAYANLFYHLDPFIQEFRTFSPRAEQELEEERSLIQSSSGDMAMLNKVFIHEQLRKKERDRDKGTMADFVNPRKMEQVRETCRAAHETHLLRYEELLAAVQELNDASDVERRSAEERSTAVQADFHEGLSRVELASAQVAALVARGVDGSVQDLVDLDRGMREDLEALTNIKNDFTLELHVHLKQIAQFQIQVVNLAPQVSQLEADLSPSSLSKAAFPHLHRLRNLPFAYAATVVEVVRRKEFGQYLSDWTGRLREALLKYTATENLRRQQVKDGVITHIPFSIPSLDDSMKVGVEVAVTTGLDALKSVHLGRSDVDALLHWIDEIKDDPEILSAVVKGDDGPIKYLQAHLDELIGKMEGNTGDLDRLIQDSVLSRSQAGISQSLMVRLQVAEQQATGHQDELETLRRAHKDRIDEIQNRHENSTTAMTRRQGELQEQIVRLRTDLEEEMLARQALSTQLEENARDQEERQREQDEHNELVTALQADVVAEKDRATDLGVRLQEALLDVDGYRNAEQTLVSKLQALQDERSKSIKALADAQNLAQGFESEIAGIKAELEAITEQLTQAREERDTALKNQSAEAERLMRDYIAESDGDRAVLEHQNLRLSKQIEDMKQETQEKLSAARNQAVRQADGLKAELQFTKAQLRTSQQKETVLADQLAMAKDSSEQANQHAARQHDIAKDAVSLVGMYHETCMKLLNTINASSTISGSASTTIGKSKDMLQLTAAPRGESQSVDLEEMKDSVALTSSLAVAQAFDLVVFADAVQKTINLVKKWGKSCKNYREAARNRISFTNFSKGDLALFLPTRNAASRIWACFNVSAPHNFLKVKPEMQEQIATREWIIARITKTEEAVASGGESLETNPFGLADGLRYWVHSVEEWSPLAPRPRRSISASYYGRSMDETPLKETPNKQATVDTPAQISEADPMSPSSPTKERAPPSYFPLVDKAQVSSTAAIPPPDLNDQDDSSPSGPTPLLSTSPQEDQTVSMPSAAAPAKAEAKKLSPVVESVSLSNPPPLALHAAPQPATSSGSDAAASRPQSRAQRPLSRISSPPSRDHPPPLFAPATFGRPASVASTASYTGHAPFASGKAAPAMAITTSSPGGRTSMDSQPGTGDLNPFMETTRARRRSSNHSLGFQDDFFRPPMLRDGSAEGSPGSSGFQRLSPAHTSDQHLPAGTTATTAQPAAQTAASVTPSPGTSPGMSASRLIRGFSLRGRATSGAEQGIKAKPSAMELLKRFDS